MRAPNALQIRSNLRQLRPASKPHLLEPVPRGLRDLQGPKSVGQKLFLPEGVPSAQRHLPEPRETQLGQGTDA